MADSLFLTNARIISPGIDREGSVLVKDGIIQQVQDSGDAPASDLETIDLSGRLLTPGFIDIHTHGAHGHDFCSGQPEDLVGMAEAKLREGMEEKPVVLHDWSTAGMPSFASICEVAGQGRASPELLRTAAGAKMCEPP